MQARDSEVKRAVAAPVTKGTVGRHCAGRVTAWPGAKALRSPFTRPAGAASIALMGKASVYLNGRMVAADEAAVSVFDTGLLHGASVFTTMLAHNGTVFRLARHLKRMLAGAERIALRHDTSAEQLAAAVGEVLTANELPEARVRVTLTPGMPAAPDQQGQPTTIVTASAVSNPAWWYKKGISVMACRFRQFAGDPTVGLKTGCYLGRILARQHAAAAGVDEALWFTPEGHLAEACFCNVFLVREGSALTPPLETPVLPGIVREAVFELCEKLKIPCQADQPLTIRDCLAAEEMFLTSSVAGVRPVVRLERHAVGDEGPGPLTRKTMAAYAKLLDRECPPPQK